MSPASPATEVMEDSSLNAFRLGTLSDSLQSRIFSVLLKEQPDIANELQTVISLSKFLTYQMEKLNVRNDFQLFFVSKCNFFF
jgi:hypothetical protein